MNGLWAKIKCQVHDPEDLRQLMQLALNIKEELVEENKGTYLSQPPTTLSIGVFKSGWSHGGVESNRLKREFRSGNTMLTTPGPKQGHLTLLVRGSFNVGSLNEANLHYSTNQQWGVLVIPQAEELDNFPM